jgi:restriction endonuclease S subunit
MDSAQLNWLTNFIWNIADDVLRDVYVRGKYRDVILPMTVLRRLDAVLEPTKSAVLEMKAALDAAGVTNQDAALRDSSGQAFYNTSPFLLRDLKSRATQQKLKDDFEVYLDGFSPNVQDILNNFSFRNQIAKLSKADALGMLIEKFLDKDINLSPHQAGDLPALDNHSMGTMFEELVRRFNEENNEEAGEHWTPRDAVRLMANLMFLPVADRIESGTYLLYDCACGTGGMLTVAEETLQQIAKQRGKQIATHLYGQEISDETYAICKADMLLKGDGDAADNIVGGSEHSTLSNDAFRGREFDFMLANPPYTGDRSIVEDSRKDDFWGALPKDDGTLVGMNVLGRLLMELREAIKAGDELRRVEPPAITNFLLFGEALQVVDFRTDKNAPVVVEEITAKETFDELTLPLFAEAVPAAASRPAVMSTAQLAERSHGMIEGLKPYPEYKESGHRWLGNVPNHWSVLPNRALFEEVKDRNHPSDEMLSVTITRGIIRQQALLSDSSKKDSSNVNKAAYKLVKPGDIAYNKMRAWQGAVGASNFRGIVSPAYVVMRPRRGCAPWYYHHLYRAPSFSKEAERWSYGITSDMWSLRPEHFKVIYSVQPPPDEQAAIVRFLDHANRKIDGFIRAKRKLIGLLNEQKQAIIHRAVTRGLDPDVPLKPSGIPWLGDIPQHWEVMRIKYILKEVDNRSKTGAEPLLSMRMHHGLVVFAEHFSRPPQAATLVGFKIVKPGQFVVNRMQAGNGVIYPSNLSFPGLVSPDYAVFDPIADVNVEYLGELFRSRKVRAKFRSESKGLGTGTSGFLRLYNDRFGAIHVALPPRKEQESILRGLGDELADLTTAIARTEREIALMQEYRTRLTADVVTGKLDVREAAAKLPEPPAEPAAVDAWEEMETETEEADTHA